MTSLVDFRNRKGHVITQAFNRLNNEGIRYALLMTLIALNYCVRLIKQKTFYFQNKELSYFYHPYNHSWVNERTVEVPIVLEMIKDYQGKSMLEVGNVLRHYFAGMNHDVIDKGEKFPGVINADVANFNSNKKYDFIVSISTMEHVGFEEDDKDVAKIPRAVQHLQKYLNPGGKIIITVPLQYNPHLDKYLSEGVFGRNVFFLKRTLFNSWREASYYEVKDLRYSKEITANALAVIVIQK